MQVPLQISFHNIDHSDAVEERIREKAAKLDQIYDHITSCRVVVEKPHKHNHQGVLYDVRIDITVPGHELVVRSNKGDHAHEDVYVAIRDAFDAAQRQIKELAERSRRSAKRGSTRQVAE